MADESPKTTIWGERLPGQPYTVFEPIDMGDGSVAVPISGPIPDWVRIPNEPATFGDWAGKEVRVKSAANVTCPFTKRKNAICITLVNCPFICVESDRFYWARHPDYCAWCETVHQGGPENCPEGDAWPAS